mmetsp:Transcript_15079/g.38114  ORF Transcript_15079/g.38114 Transcript_15079/m.38114 type:complete len:175 (-) Transcript_15079:301-825(-)
MRTADSQRGRCFRRGLVPSGFRLLFVCVFLLALTLIIIWESGVRILEQRETQELGNFPLQPGFPSSLPPSREVFGNAGWAVLHTIAASLPSNATEDELEDLGTFLHVLQRHFPCEECKGHFGNLLKGLPPVLTSSDAFLEWTCHAHNRVNRRLGKPVRQCRIGELRQKWKLKEG